MKVVILAGGLQSALGDGGERIPKPMAEIGGRPLLWHIMKNFAEHGYKDFIICGGFKVDLIKQYFKDFYIYESDITIDLQTNTIRIHKNITENWNVTVIDTGIITEQGKRILKIREYIDEDNFFVIYGDCLNNINYKAMLEQHMYCKKIAMMALTHPVGRYKALPVIENELLVSPNNMISPESQVWVDACCWILNTQVFQYLEKNYKEENGWQNILAIERQVATYRHSDFWSPVETRRDQSRLEALWQENYAPWKNWCDK